MQVVLILFSHLFGQSLTPCLLCHDKERRWFFGLPGSLSALSNCSGQRKLSQLLSLLRLTLDLVDERHTKACLNLLTQFSSHALDAMV